MCCSTALTDQQELQSATTLTDDIDAQVINSLKDLQEVLTTVWFAADICGTDIYVKLHCVSKKHPKHFQL